MSSFLQELVRRGGASEVEFRGAMDCAELASHMCLIGALSVLNECTNFIKERDCDLGPSLAPAALLPVIMPVFRCPLPDWALDQACGVLRTILGETLVMPSW